MTTKIRFAFLALTTSILPILVVFISPTAFGFLPNAPVRLHTPVQAQSDEQPSPTTLTLTDEQGEYPLGLHLELLEDPDRVLTIEDITSPEFDSQFVRSQVEVPNYGFTESAYWVRLRLDNQTRQDSDWLLDIGYANMHFIDLYIPSDDGFEVRSTGVMRPPATRDILYPEIVFKILLPPQSAQTFYFRFENGASMTLPLTLWSSAAFLNQSNQEQMLHGVFFGVMFGLLFYNLFLLFSLRDKNYFYFAFLLFSTIFNQAVYFGYSELSLFYNLYYLKQYYAALSFTFLISAIILFSDSFLELKARHPGFHKINLIILAGWAILLALSMFSSYHTIVVPMFLWALISLATVIISGFLSWRQGFQPARFFMLAWFGMLLTFGLALLVRLGVIPSTTFSENLYLFGLSLVAVCWSVALADRINLMKIEKEVAYLAEQASEKCYRQLVETMNDGMGAIDENGRFTYLNTRLAEMLGYAPEEILGHPVAEFTDQEYLPILAKELQERRHGSSKAYELVWQRKDGSQIFTIVSPVPLFEDGRSYKGAFAVVTDITERVMAGRTLEQQVDERTRELSTLLGISRDISASKDLSVVLERIMERLKTVIDYQGLVILADQDGKWRVLSADWLSLTKKTDPFELSPSDAQAVVSDFGHGEPILIRNLDLEGADNHGFWKIASRLSQDCIPPIHCWLGVPLYERGNILGLLILGCKEAGPSGDQVKLIVASANQMAISIENNHLYQQIRDTVMFEERNRLARDLHDSVTQVLFSASLLADILPKIWHRDPELGLQKLDKLRQLNRGALAEMRTLLLELRPSAVVNTPLGDLLAQLVEAVTSRSGLPFQLLTEQIPPLPENVQINIYRIAQEALNNVVKHAQARKVTVILNDTALLANSISKERHEIKLVIQDDGVGFSSKDRRSDHMGIGIMHERAAAIQANLSLESQPGYGTRVTLTWRSESENLS